MADRDMIKYQWYLVHLEQWDVDVMAVRTDDGRVFWAFRHLCERLAGVSYSSQLQVLKGDPEEYPEGEAVMRFTVPTDGGDQEMVFLIQVEAAWWLLHLKPNRVAARIRNHIRDLVADLRAEGDRLVFRNLLHVVGVERAMQIYRSPAGVIQLPCLRCGALHEFTIKDGRAGWQIVDDPQGPSSS